MKTVWTNGLNAEKKEEMRREYVASAHLRSRLRKLLEDKIESRYKKSILESSYENPNWALLQADAAGYQRALTEVISLISEERNKNISKN